MKTYTAHTENGVYMKDVIVHVHERLKYAPCAQAGILKRFDVTWLMSYDALIVGIDSKGNIVQPISGGLYRVASPHYSRTTAKHVSLFLRQVAPQYTLKDVDSAFSDDSTTMVMV